MRKENKQQQQQQRQQANDQKENHFASLDLVKRNGYINKIRFVHSDISCVQTSRLLQIIQLSLYEDSEYLQCENYHLRPICIFSISREP